MNESLIIKKQLETNKAFSCQFHFRQWDGWSCRKGIKMCNPITCNDYRVGLHQELCLRCPVCGETVGAGYYNVFSNHFQENHPEYLLMRVTPSWNGEKFRELPKEQVGEFGIFPMIDNQDSIMPTTEPKKDDKPSVDIGSKPGAGNPKPTKIKNGAVHRAVRWLETELAKEGINEIIMLDAVLQTGISQGSIWAAVMKLTTEQPSTYEYYQDLTRKYHPKGIRKIEVAE